MNTTKGSICDHRATQGATANKSLLLDVRQLAELLGCSARHVYRLSDAAQMPRPVKLGALVRWRRNEIEGWIFDGCPSCRKAVSR